MASLIQQVLISPETGRLAPLLRSWHFMLPLLLVSIVATTVIYRIFLHPLAKFPGPLEAKVSGLWRTSRYWAGTWHDDILQVHEKYGPVVRIAPNELAIVDENAIKTLFGHGTKSVKTSWYNTWQDPAVAPSFFATTDRKLHSVLRKRVSGAYSMSAMLRYEGFMQKIFDLMIQRLRKHADAGHVVDMAEWTEMLAFDLVGELTYGTPLGQLETESDTFNTRSAIHSGFFMMANMGHMPGQTVWIFHPAMKRLMQLLGAPNPFDSFIGWTTERILERKQSENSAQREDMLQHFLSMKTTNDEPVALADVVMESANIIGAGADTTSIAMRSCLYYLGTHLEAYRKVQKEVDDYYEKHHLERPISYHQTQQLPYFCAAIREALRMFPSIVYQLYRYAPSDMEVNGKVIPAGTAVGMSPIAANRDRNVWGPDANEFKPERWLESEAKTRYLNSCDMTFGGNGPRACIGKNLALVEVHKFLAQLLRSFDVEFVNPEKPWTVHSLWFAEQRDMHMRIRYRWGSSEAH